MLIVSLSGYARSGKDSVADFLVQDHGFKRYAFADRLRGALLALDPYVAAENGTVRLSRLIDFRGWDEAKVEYPEVRRLMQVMGTDVGRSLLGQDIWVNLLFKQLGEENPERAVLTDCRFPNEIGGVLDCGGFPVWVKRDGVGPLNSHISEVSVSAEDCVTTLENSGSRTDLRQNVAGLAERLGF